MRVPAASLALALLLPLSGCTLFPDQQPGTLATTTSAERVNQIFWEDAASAKWETVQTLMAPGIAWAAPDKTLSTAPDILARLQGWKITSAQTSDAHLLANGDSITVNYTLQSNDGGQQHTRRMSAVWQRTTGKKPASPYLLTFMAESPAS